MFFAANWWESFGSHCPQLQKFAIRVLSQTCSASGCERNWSVFERIHTKKRNRLEQKQLNDLVFVQYNLRLRRNQLLNKRPDSDPIVLDDVDPTSDWVVETHPPEFDVDYDLEVELAGQVQMDADPLLGPAVRFQCQTWQALVELQAGVVVYLVCLVAVVLVLLQLVQLQSV
jgi:hypothetical protein